METKNDRVSKSEKPRALNLQLHTRVYLLSYVRYLCRTKSHLCRSQNKLLIIEIRRISRRYVNGLHTVDEARRNHVVVPAPFGAGSTANFAMRSESSLTIFIKIVNYNLSRICVFVNINLTFVSLCKYFYFAFEEDVTNKNNQHMIMLSMFI